MLQNHITLIIKPTKQCPARCLHCAAEDRRNNARMSLENFETICKEMNKFYDYVHFIWHGGEPMLMGPEFYYKAYDIAKRELKDFHFGMQSNLLLYTSKRNEWKRCFNELFDGYVGTSWDFGTTPRRYKTESKEGEKYYIEKFSKEIKAFLEDGFRLFTIYVMNRYNIQLAPKILETILELKIAARVNYLYDSGRGTLLKDWFVPEKEYIKSIKSLCIQWVEALINKDAVDVEPFSTLLKLYLHPEIKEAPCPWKGDCPGRLFGIEPDGSIYNCSEMADSGATPYGNIYHQPLSEILTSKIFLKQLQFSKKPPEFCLDCKEFGKFCRGLCLAEKLYKSKDSSLKARRSILYRCSTLKTCKKVFDKYPKEKLYEGFEILKTQNHSQLYELLAK